MMQYHFDYNINSHWTRDKEGLVYENDGKAIDHAWAMLPRIIAEMKPVVPWQYAEVIVRRGDGAQIGKYGMMVSLEAPTAEGPMSVTVQLSADLQKVYKK